MFILVIYGDSFQTEMNCLGCVILLNREPVDLAETKEWQLQAAVNSEVVAVQVQLKEDGFEVVQSFWLLYHNVN